MSGKLWFVSGLAIGYVLGTRAGREKYDELVANARQLWQHPTVQEAAGVVQAQSQRLVSEGRRRLEQQA
ncbi:hypothetical protein F4553_003065 [Allocatelliglobosispora scoriae]|uniref:YtxH domain-containing protein n=1 Tax=Allocatelliglobosispora scoriae TaxID=643052 RepID=A0A841BQR7_9ACTN|nr:hypothetical protein [Allocatelliglobosispora scoriae]